MQISYPDSVGIDVYISKQIVRFPTTLDIKMSRVFRGY